MSFARDDGITATLPDGRVLVAGGYDGRRSTDVAELYDPATGTFSETDSMDQARSGASAVVLLDGRVLVVGGWANDRATASAEIYDPETEQFTPAGSMRNPRATGIAVRLLDGRVLIAGGANHNQDLAAAEIYDPATGTFTATDAMSTTRYGLMASLLDDGRVLVMGGWNGSRNLASAEIYDPETGRFGRTGAMNERRQIGVAITLPDGRVLVAGGWNERRPEQADPWSTASSAEVFDPESGSFSAVGSMNAGRTEAVIGLTSNGMVLIAGGGDGSDETRPFASADLFDPSTNEFQPVDPGMADPRSGPAMVATLPDGSLLVVGGWYGDGVLNTAEVFGP